MKIIYPVISFVELLLYYISALAVSVKILDVKCKNIRIKLSFLFFIPLMIAELMSDNNTVTFINALFVIVEILVLKFSLSKVRLRSIISIYVFLYLINTIIISSVSFLLSLRETGELITEMAVNIITTTICMIICHTKLRIKVKQILMWTPKAIKNLLIALLVCCSVLIILILYEPIYKNVAGWTNAVKISLIVLIILLAFAMPILIIYSMTNKHTKSLADNYKKQLDAQSEHYSMLSESNFELRRFRHDYKNMCIGLSKLISEGKKDEALEMLNNGILKLNSSVIKFDTGNGIADALLTAKQKQADKINTQIKFEGAIPQSKIKPTDLCVIFGNTIDNALEACAKINSSAEKIISVSCICNSGFVFIKITNPVAQKVIIDGQLPATTKTDKNMHGFGLYSLEQVVKQNNGEVSFECDDNIFEVSVEFGI